MTAFRNAKKKFLKIPDIKYKVLSIRKGNQDWWIHMPFMHIMPEHNLKLFIVRSLCTEKSVLKSNCGEDEALKPYLTP